jgi:hypothetical protein
MPETPPASPPPGPVRTVERIVVETFLVAVAGALVLGFAWELGKVEIGWTIAIIIWIAGAPLLEIIRMLVSRH